MRFRHIVGILGTAIAALMFAASVVAAETRMPFTETLDNPCTGEMLVATGTLVENTDVTTDPDGMTHFHSTVFFHGMTATAPLSGHKYVVQDQTIENDNADSDGAPTITNFKVKIHWVRTGEGGALIDDDDFYDWFHIHMTLNANGVPTSTTIDTEDDVCR